MFSIAKQKVRILKAIRKIKCNNMSPEINGQLYTKNKIQLKRYSNSTSSQDILEKIDLGLVLNGSKRTDNTIYTIDFLCFQSRAQIIKLLQDISPNQKANVPRAKIPLQTVDYDTSIQPKMPQSMVMLHVRSTSEATLVNNSTNECEMQYCVQLFFSKYQNYNKRSRAGQNGNCQTKTNQDSIIVKNDLGGIINKYIFSICNGHGVYGHYISLIVKKCFQNQLINLSRLLLGSKNKIQVRFTIPKYQRF